MAYGVYVAQNWVDGSSSTPVSAARLNNEETGIFNSFYAPAVRVFHSVNQSLTSSVATALAFNSERFDQAGNAANTQHDNVTNNSRLTCRYAGVYQISGTVSFSTNAVGARVLQLRMVGVTVASEEVAAVNGGPTDLSISTLYAMAVNDYVELFATQTSGGALNVLTVGNY
jgi:hypothetical protein